MKKADLDIKLKEFDRNGKSAEDLNAVRTLIFNSLDQGDIRESTKNSLLKDLYRSASIKGIFFVRVIERKTQDLPKTPEEEAELEEEEDESYEESYEESYWDDDEEEEQQP